MNESPQDEQKKDEQKPEDAGERDAEEGIAGYGQAPAGVRTTKLGSGPEYDWGKQQTPPASPEGENESPAVEGGPPY